MNPYTLSMDCTCAALRKAARRLSQTYDAVLAPEGLKTSQYSVLAMLDCWPGETPTVQPLADALALDRTTLGHNLRPLQRAGLVTIDADAFDRRIRRVGLTAAGQAKLRACFPLWREVQNRFDKAYGAERSAALREALLAIAHGLDLGVPLMDKDDVDVC